MKQRELKPYRDYVASALTKYARSKPVVAALVLSNELLQFKPIYGWSKEIRTQQHLQRLTRLGATPRDVLAQVIAFYAYVDANPRRFDCQRTEHFALARLVVMIRPMGKDRPGAHVLNMLGGMVADELGGFCIAFLRRLQSDAVTRLALKREAVSWESEPYDTPATPLENPQEVQA